MGVNLQQAGLPLMQVWQESLAADGVTLFTNPLSPNTPLQALTDGSHTRQRMAMDVFATNAIRAIRMQSPRVGVVIAARAGGQILFGFNATDSAFEVVPQVFVWNLSSSDNIAVIQHNFLDLMAECRVEHIRILHDVLPENADLPTYAQSLSLDGHNPQLKVIEVHQNLSDTATAILTNAVTEAFVAKEAFLDYYKLQNDSLTASLIDNTYISQEANSHASVHTFSFGATLTRNNLNFYHQGEHLESTLKGLSILKGSQHTDHYTLVNHAYPNCESHQDYKSIVSDEATNVFNGKIMVEQIAQKTNAYQQNDNILLSDKATVYTKPQLEIFADDVKCSHGCTVGSLSAQTLYSICKHVE